MKRRQLLRRALPTDQALQLPLKVLRTQARQTEDADMERQLPHLGKEHSRERLLDATKASKSLTPQPASRHRCDAKPRPPLTPSFYVSCPCAISVAGPLIRAPTV